MLEYVVVLVVLLFLSAFFSSSETAFLSLQRVRLEHWVREGVPGAARVARMLERPHSLLSAILLGNNLVNTAAAAVGTVIATQLLTGAEGEAVLVATIVITVLLVLFGEVVPKTLALSHAFAMSRIWAYPLALWRLVAQPVVWGLDHLTRTLLRVFGGGDMFEPAALDLAELRTAIRVGVESGSIEAVESSRLLGALALQQRQVQEIMVPRVDIVAIHVDEPLDEAARRIAESGFLRLPVYDRTLDDFVGYVHVSDVNAARLDSPVGADVRSIMRAVVFESEHSSIAHVLELMRARATHLVMLVDEYGSTSGLVTIEDIVEEVVGSLPSESGDEPEQEPVPEAGGRFEVEGSRLLVDLSNELGTDLTDVEANTVAGLVLAYTHRFPVAGEHIDHAGYRFSVLEVDERRVTRVLVEPLPRDEEDGA
jgi:putative hemolysin